MPFIHNRLSSQYPLTPSSTQKSIYGEDSIKENPAVRILMLLLLGFLGGVGTITFVDDRYIRSDVATAENALANTRVKVVSLQSSNRDMSEKIRLLEEQLNASDAGVAGSPCFETSTRYRKDGNKTP